MSYSYVRALPPFRPSSIALTPCPPPQGSGLTTNSSMPLSTIHTDVIELKSVSESDWHSTRKAGDMTTTIASSVHAYDRC